jgi:4-hydroxy-4-methyl-2-oxoglutarate aldolase
VLGDDDGVVFIASDQAGEVLATARQIARAERDQARKVQAGQTLRQQTTFGEYGVPCVMSSSSHTSLSNA